MYLISVLVALVLGSWPARRDTIHHVLIHCLLGRGVLRLTSVGSLLGTTCWVLCPCELSLLEQSGLWHQVWRTQQNKAVTTTRCNTVLPDHSLCFVRSSSDCHAASAGGWGLGVGGGGLFVCQEQLKCHKVLYSQMHLSPGCQRRPCRKIEHLVLHFFKCYFHFDLGTVYEW